CIFLFCFLVLHTGGLFSQDMEIQWQQCYGGSEDEVVYDIIPYSGGYLVAGGTASEDGDITFSHGSSEFWIIKINSVGSLLWEKTFGGSSGEFCTRILDDLDNSFYLIGSSVSSDGDISYDPYPGSNDIWVVKIDSAGNILWDKIIGGGMIDAIESASVTNDGGIAIFGWTGSQNGDVSINYGMYDMWLVKLNSDGDIVWDKSYGTDDFDWGIDIIQTRDGGFLIGGASTIGDGGNLTCEPYNLNAEAILLKLDSLGNIEWQNCYGGSGHDGIYSLMELEDGYLISAYGESEDGDLVGSGWHGGADIWVIKIDFFGNIIWQKCYGGSNYESALNIFSDSNNGFVLIGATESQNGDITNNHSISEYDNDIWYLKIDSVGEIINQKCFGGIGNDFIYRSAVQKGNNDYVIAAYTDFGPSYDVLCEPYGGNGDEDWWVFEINDTTVSVNEKGQTEQLKVYPNPANTYVVFEHPVVSQGTIRIRNPYGQLVAELPAMDEKTVWDTHGIRAGMYYYSFTDSGKSQSGKILIIR
ncbi:MAG: T9SS type A sorting domain-containing protein, partial [Bacteroidales bacterium]